MIHENKIKITISVARIDKIINGFWHYDNLRNT